MPQAPQALPRLYTPLTRRIGLVHPVVLAPMAGVSGGALAAAVSRAGGLGLVGAGYGDEAWLRTQMGLAGDVPVGVGFIAWALQRTPRLLDVALEFGPPVVFLSFGAVEPFAARVKRAGARLIVQVQTVAQARQAVAEGADIVVAQGTEAGGHGGLRATLPLVPAVVDALGDTPVLAAGGIADGRGLAAALCLGATGVLCGTVFYGAFESLAHPSAKQRLFAASGDDTLRSPVFDQARGLSWPAPWQLRSLSNGFTRQWAADPQGLQHNLAQEQQRFSDARAAGDFDVAAVIAGEAADLVQAAEPAEITVHRMVAGAAAEMARVRALWQEQA